MWACDMLSQCDSTIKRALGPTATNGHLISQMWSPPLWRKTSVKSMTLRQSGKSSLTSWPDVKLNPQTNNLVYSNIMFIC